MKRRIRIRTVLNEQHGNCRYEEACTYPKVNPPCSQDVVVELIGEDGSVDRLQDVTGLSIRVDVNSGRSPVTVYLEVRSPELDVEGILANVDKAVPFARIDPNTGCPVPIPMEEELHAKAAEVDWWRRTFLARLTPSSVELKLGDLMAGRRLRLIDEEAAAAYDFTHSRNVGFDQIVTALVGRGEFSAESLTTCNLARTRYEACMKADDFDLVVRPPVDRLQQYKSLSWSFTAADGKIHADTVDVNIHVRSSRESQLAHLAESLGRALKWIGEAT